MRGSWELSELSAFSGFGNASITAARPPDARNSCWRLPKFCQSARKCCAPNACLGFSRYRQSARNSCLGLPWSWHGPRRHLFLQRWSRLALEIPARANPVLLERLRVLLGLATVPPERSKCMHGLAPATPERSKWPFRLSPALVPPERLPKCCQSARNGCSDAVLC